MDWLSVLERSGVSTVRRVTSQGVVPKFLAQTSTSAAYSVFSEAVCVVKMPENVVGSSEILSIIVVSCSQCCYAAGKPSRPVRATSFTSSGFWATAGDGREEDGANWRASVTHQRLQSLPPVLVSNEGIRKSSTRSQRRPESSGGKEGEISARALLLVHRVILKFLQRAPFKQKKKKKNLTFFFFWHNHYSSSSLAYGLLVCLWGEIGFLALSLSLSLSLSLISSL